MIETGNFSIAQYFTDWCEFEQEMIEEINDPNIRLDWFGLEVGEA
jgi:hypothetical protein